MRYKIALIPGDGIGPELTETTLRVLGAVRKKCNLDLKLVELEAGDSCYRKKGVALPEETISGIKDSHACLKGPVGETAADVVVKLRMMLDLYANIRPIKSYPNVPCVRDDIDLVLVRENTEDLYRGLEFMLDDTAIALRVTTRKGCERIARRAFELALRRQKKRKITAIHKANVMRLTCGLFAQVCREVAKGYPDIAFEEQYVDAASMRLIREPQNFDVIVTTNMFGDILSDEAAQLVGGLGMAPGANIGNNFALFEPVHGSAPPLVGRHTANPCSMILAAKMMLEWLGEEYRDPICMSAAQTVETGLAEALLKGLTVPDLGGKLRTVEMGEAIADEVMRSSIPRQR
jgi:3-isopropylmalate dehydrogenase